MAVITPIEQTEVRQNITSRECRANTLLTMNNSERPCPAYAQGLKERHGVG